MSIRSVLAPVFVVSIAGTALASAASGRLPKVELCHVERGTGSYHSLSVPLGDVFAHLRHGDSRPGEYFADLDADGFGDPFSDQDVCPNPGTVDDATDCDDTDPAVYPDASEADNLVDDDCDGWADEDYVNEGDVIITEIVRNPRFGTASTVAEGQWFEVYNTSAREVDLRNWYVIRSNSPTSTDAFFVDPAAKLVLPPHEYAVFCKTDTYEGDPDADRPLWCDYIWGDTTMPSTWSDLYHDNTFNLQRDADGLGFYLEGGSLLGRLVDRVVWTWSTGAPDNWPRDASYSTSLDPDSFDGTANDLWSNWCSTALGDSSSAYSWWVNGLTYEHGTPGTDNYACN